MPVRHVGRALARAVRRQLLVLGLVRILLLEEEEEESEGGGLVGRYRREPREPPAGAPRYEFEYLESVERMTEQYSRNAKLRLWRHQATVVTALGASAGVPVAVAAGAPGWLVAALGALAVVGQGLQQLLRDRELGTQSHALAVALSGALRRLRFESGASTDYQQRRVFEDFVKETEALLSSQGDVMLELMRQEAKMPTTGAAVAPQIGTERAI